MADSDKDGKQKSFLAINWLNLIEQANFNKQKVIDTIKEHDLDGKFLQKEYENGKYLYIQSEELGISLQLESNILNCVYFYNKNDKKFKEYQGSIPYQINFMFKNGEVVQFLGEPSQKNGGSVTPISIAYDHLGIEFTFQTKNWSDRESAISFICLFKKDMSQNIKKCGICQKQTDNLCSRCKLVYYCSQDCQKQHFPSHKDKCKQYSTLQIKNQQ